MEEVLENASNLDNEENLATDSKRVKASVIGADSTDFGGSQKHDVANQAGRLALTASQETSDENKGGNDASAAQVGSSLWRQIAENDKLE